LSKRWVSVCWAECPGFW